MLRRILSVIISFLMIFSVFSFNTFATSSETPPPAPTGDFIVAVDTVKANAGDSVIVKLRVKNNPGIMAMTISITYDSSVLEFKRYYYGKVFSDYTLKEHPSRNIIRLVISEEYDVYGDGAIIGIQFKIADNAEAKLHEMTVKYSSGDFCNNNLERLMPKIEAGGVEVAYNGTNCGHRNYNEWSESIAPTCTKNGAEQRTCTKCGHVELRETEPAGHDYSDKFTVDIPATKDSAGVMSRHCKNCDATTNETHFTLQQSDEGNIDNIVDSTVPDNDVTKDIIDKQHPDLNDSSTSDKTDSSTSSSSSEGSSEKNEKPKDDETQKEEENTQEQIKDIIEIISPDKTDDEVNESAISITQKLREVFPQIDKMINVFKTSVIILLIIIIL